MTYDEFVETIGELNARSFYNDSLELFNYAKQRRIILDDTPIPIQRDMNDYLGNLWYPLSLVADLMEDHTVTVNQHRGLDSEFSGFALRSVYDSLKYFEIPADDFLTRMEEYQRA